MDQDHVLKKIDQLFQKISHLEKSIQEKGNPPVIVKMEVKDLHLQQLNLEELAFHLDKLDIKELSGMLNLGNTFSPTVHRRPSPKTRPSQEKPVQQYRKDIQIKVNGKLVPYTKNSERL
ncbi:hypothetical protein [Neobacillus dielmonensis]|uniref:hypothetical protein n=1 Tax=Neobacillus dielmonensis TaxID=1347369 RepID=UPI00069420FA|nr:hypothetical protein [Neobacillus dielmonensis]